MHRHVLFIIDLSLGCLLGLSEAAHHRHATAPARAHFAAFQSPQQAANESRVNEKAKLEEVIAFEKFQPTGVAVSRDGRVFVNFPRWSDQHEHSVVEVMPDGTARPYPDAQWNAWSEDDTETSPSKSFICVQSVWVDDENTLWILDPAAPGMKQVVPGGPKLVKVDLASDRVSQVITFDEQVAPKNSYLNDVRVDTQREWAYITESGMGAIIAVNLKEGTARRLLDDHSSTKAEADVKLVVQGVELKDEQGKTPQIHADGIALSHDGEHLYWHALTGKTLYRIATPALRGETEALQAPEAIARAVEKVAETVVTDGMLIDEQGRVYHTALESSSISRYVPGRGMEALAQDERIAWPDSMSFGSKGELYFTTSQIHLMPRFNQGQDKRTEPYRVCRMALGE